MARRRQEEEGGLLSSLIVAGLMVWGFGSFWAHVTDPQTGAEMAQRERQIAIANAERCIQNIPNAALICRAPEWGGGRCISRRQAEEDCYRMSR